jgi:lipopolysaccharide export system protein LptA
MNVTVTVTSGDRVIDSHTLTVDTDTGKATVSHGSGGHVIFDNVREAKTWLLGQISTDITYGRQS